MIVRYQADADLNQIILRGVIRREPAIEFVTPAEGELIDQDDRTVLELAARHGRILVSHDRKTMSRHFYEFIETNDSPGVFVIRQQRCPVAVAIEELLMIWEASEAEEWVNQYRYLPL